MKLKRPQKGWLWGAIAIATFLAICLATPVRLLFDFGALTEELHMLGELAPVLFVVIFIVATAFGFPGNVMTVAGGAVFGLTMGTVCSVIGATVGSVVAFWLARSLLHQWAVRHLGHHPMLQRLNRAIAYHPFNFVLAVRLAPISPFSLMNFLFGLTPVQLKPYTFGTLVGITPGTFAYAWLGTSGQRALTGGDLWPVFWALALLTLLSLLPFWMKRATQRV